MHSESLDIALLFLLAAVIAVPVFRRFGLGAVLGYLAAGVVLGPFGTGVVRDAERVLAASEIGVVMMLFVIGLELSLPRLKVMRKPVFGVGGLQVLACGVALAAIAMLGGLGAKAAWVVGFGLALSSTAVGLQLLAERKALTAPHGRLAFAILLFQDIAAIPLLAVIPLLGVGAAGDAEGGWQAVGIAIAAIAALVFGGRLLLRHVFRIVARSQMPEVFTGAALLIVLGSAWMMQHAGLSAGLGAFIAGVLLADSEFRHELEAQIEPFKGLLLGLFFMAVGMSIDLGRVLAEPAAIAALVAVLMLVKFTLIFVIGRGPGRLDMREAAQLATVLALGGEFAFVVFAEAVRAGLLDLVVRDRLVAAVGVSMALTPVLLIGLAYLLKARPRERAPRDADALPEDGQPQVLIAGFGRFGQIVARVLAMHDTPFIVIEHDVEQLEFSRRFGNTLYYGDPARPDLLRAAGAAQVRVFVVAIDDPAEALRTSRAIRHFYPEARVIAQARDRRVAWELKDLGVEPVREVLHSSLQAGSQVLQALGVAAAAADALTARFAEHDARLFEAQHPIRHDQDALLQTVQDARRELEELLRADAGEGVLGQAGPRAAPGTPPSDAPAGDGR